jgi:acetyltransferase-like isoleucine patch superfamily enzyme
MATGLVHLRARLRGVALPVRRGLDRLQLLRLRWIYLADGIEGVSMELRTMRRGYADALRLFGAHVARDAAIIGPINIVNAAGDYRNLHIGPGTHIGSEVFIDLADRVTIEAGATISMRSVIITHFDAGRSPIADRRPRRTGPVTVGAGAYIGAGAIILHGVRIGREALVGATALIAHDVPDGATVRISPDRAADGTAT